MSVHHTKITNAVKPVNTFSNLSPEEIRQEESKFGSIQQYRARMAAVRQRLGLAPKTFCTPKVVSIVSPPVPLSGLATEGPVPEPQEELEEPPTLPNGVRHPPTMAQIRRAVSVHFRVSLDELTSPDRTQRVAFARQVGCFLCYCYTEQSLPMIGSRFGDRDHTTVLHSVRKVRDLLKINPSSVSQVQKVLNELDKSCVMKKTDRAYTLV